LEFSGLTRIYSASRLNEVILYLCPSVSICGSYFLMYFIQHHQALYSSAVGNTEKKMA